MPENQAILEEGGKRKGREFWQGGMAPASAEPGTDRRDPQRHRGPCVFSCSQPRVSLVSATGPEKGPEPTLPRVNSIFRNLSWPEIWRLFIKHLLRSRRCDKHGDPTCPTWS